MSDKIDCTNFVDDKEDVKFSEVNDISEASNKYLETESEWNNSETESIIKHSTCDMLHCYNYILKGSEMLIQEFPSSEDLIDTKEQIEKI